MMEGESMDKILKKSWARQVLIMIFIVTMALVIAACTTTAATSNRDHTRNVGDQFAVWGFCTTRLAAENLWC